MSEPSVTALLRHAVQNSDPVVMRHALELLFTHGGQAGLSPAAEYEARTEDYVMEMPQSGERISGREAMRAMQEAYPTPPTIRLRRVLGSHGSWIVEGVNDYRGDLWHLVLILELTDDGRIRRDTRYYSQPFDPPPWRAPWAQPMDAPLRTGAPDAGSHTPPVPDPPH